MVVNSPAQGRVPPHDLEAEASVIGSILLDPAAISRVLDVVEPEDFYRENNGQIYRAALELFRLGEPIDNVTLAAALEKMGVLERVGGRAHLATLQASVPTAANAEHYARIVKGRSYKRQLIRAGTQVTALGYEDALDAGEAVNQAQSHVYAISDDQVGGGMERLYDLLKPAMDRIDAQMAMGGGVVGVASGFHELDRITNGFKPSELIIIAGRPAMGKCLSASTLIDAPDGERLTIEECVRRRMPACWGVSPAGAVRVTAISDWVDSGMRECYRVETRTGRWVEVTGHHPFLTASGWRPLHDLTVGTPIAVPRRVPSFGTCGGPPTAIARLLARGLWWRCQITGSGRIPAWAWRWDRRRLWEFLRALMRWPGGGERPGRTASFASRELADDARHALTRFGIVASVRRGTGRRWWVEVEGGAANAPGPVRSARTPVAAGAVEGHVPAAVPSPSERWLDGPDLHWDQIVAIESLGRRQVFDLTVLDGANFIAQDVVVHNTSFVLNLALHAAVEHQTQVAIFSLEMSKEQLVERMLCEQARIDAQRLHRGTLGEPEYERLARALGPLGDAPIFIDDSPMLDDLTLRLKARQARARDGIELIIIDYLQLMHGRARGDDSNRVQEVSNISRALKSIARELRVPVIAISQLSRAPEQRPDKRPILSDLRECVAGSTRLVDADSGRWVPIKDVRPGEHVLGVDRDQRVSIHRVADVWSTGVKPTYDIATATGKVLRCTANHPLLTPAGFKPVGTLRPGDLVASASVDAVRGAGERPLGDGSLQRSEASDLLWEEIRRILPAGEEEVFDISVPGCQNFLANGLVAHNSGSIEQDSDLVMFLYRDDYYNREKSEKPGIAEVIVAKHRNGPTGVIELMFRRELTRFENLERRHQEPVGSES
jgi:replicative DNA helicase